MKRDKTDYIESKIPAEKHKYLGWFYHYPTKKFYRWNDFPGNEKRWVLGQLIKE